MKHMPDHYSVTQDRALWSFHSWTVMSWQSEAEKHSSPCPAHRNWQFWSEYCGRSETQELPVKAEISNGLSIFLHQAVSVKINLLNLAYKFPFLIILLWDVGSCSPTFQPQPRWCAAGPPLGVPTASYQVVNVCSLKLHLTVDWCFVHLRWRGSAKMQYYNFVHFFQHFGSCSGQLSGKSGSDSSPCF